MGLRWADSFDHYGTTPSGGRTMMLSGPWAAFGSGNNTLPFVSTEQARTGTHSLKIQHSSLATGSGAWARRVYGETLAVVGHGFGMYFDHLPVNTKFCGIEIRNASNVKIGKISIEPDGSILAEALGTDVGLSDPKITASAWHHLEYKWVIDPIVGEVEIRVNGLVVIHETDLNTGSVGASQFVIGTLIDGGSAETFFIDDMFCWDDTGTDNNDFLGTQRATTLFVNGDTAQADWSVIGAADGYAAIDEETPDGDSSYILAEDTGDTSEFTLPAMPPETELIAGVYIPTLAKLDDAGTGNIQVSMVSGSDVSEGADTVLTTAYTYWGDAHDVDPATGDPWTKAGIEAALIRVEKTV